MPSLIATLGANISGFTSELERARGHARSVGTGIGDEFSKAMSGKLGSVFSLVGMEEGIRHTARWAEEIKNLSARTHVPVMEMQELSFIAQKVGVDVMDIVKAQEAVRLAQAKVTAGGADSAKAFQALRGLGLSTEQIYNQERVRDNFAQILNTLKDINEEDLGEYLRAFEGLGKGGKSFRNLLPLAAEGMDQAKVGFIPMREATLNAMADVDDAFDIAKQGGKIFFGEIIHGWLQMGGVIASTVEAIKRFDFKDLWAGLIGQKDRVNFQGPFDIMAAQESKDDEIKRNLARYDAIMAADKKRTDGVKAELARQQAEKDKIRQADTEANIMDQKRYWESLKPQEKRAVLQDNIALMEEGLAGESKFFGKMSELERAQAQRALAAARLELAALPDEKDKKEEKEKERTRLKAAKEMGPAIASGAFLGGYMVAPETIMLEVQKKSEMHLGAIKADINAVRKALTRPQNASGPQF